MYGLCIYIQACVYACIFVGNPPTHVYMVLEHIRTQARTHAPVSIHVKYKNINKEYIRSDVAQSCCLLLLSAHPRRLRKLIANVWHEQNVYGLW